MLVGHLVIDSEIHAMLYIGKANVCFTSSYLCTDATITDAAIAAEISCDQNDLILCQEGCDLETAECSGEGENLACRRMYIG